MRNPNLSLHRMKTRFFPRLLSCSKTAVSEDIRSLPILKGSAIRMATVHRPDLGDAG